MTYTTLKEKTIRMAINKKTYVQKRYCFLYEDVDEDSSADVIEALLELDLKGPGQDIVLVINSYGGSVDAMWSIVDCMNLISCQVHTLVLGKAMSAAALILMNGAKGKRYATPHARIMIHQISGAHEGKAADLKVEAKETERMKSESDKFILSKTEITAERLKEMMQHDCYLTATQAKNVGIIDKVIKNFSDIKVKGW